MQVYFVDPHLLQQVNLVDDRDDVAELVADDTQRCPVVRRETRTKTFRVGQVTVVREYEAVVAYSSIPNIK